MVILSITAKSKRMYEVKTDGESFVLTAEELYRFGLHETAPLSERDRSEISALEVPEETRQEIYASLRKRALAKSGDLLKNQDYSRKKLMEKLILAGFPSSVAEATVRSLEDAHYVDDLRLAVSYVRCHLSDKSRARILNDLMKKGISEETSGKALAEVLEEEGGEDALLKKETEQIQMLLTKRHYDPETADFNEKQKTMAFLYRKGFPADLIRQVMR